MDDPAENQQRTENKAPTPQEVTQRVYLAEDLFRGDREILIKHGTSNYRLRVTRAGKLLLTK